MRLEAYWGVGPKTAGLLRESIGESAAIDAIETADVRTLAEAGLPRGRAVRILRRAAGTAGVDVLGTSDTRSVYDDLLGLASEYAVTDHAADRIRVMTPLTDRTDIEARLDDVLAAKAAWTTLADADRERVLAAFAEYDDAGGTDRAAVEAALELRAVGLAGSTFAALGDVDEAALEAAAGALGYIREGSDGSTVIEGADEELDRLRDQLDAARDLDNAAFDIIDTVRDGGVRDMQAFQSGVVDHVADQTGIPHNTIRSAAPDEAVDAADFVSATLRELVDDLESRVDDRESVVIEDLRSRIETAEGDVEAAVDAVGEIALSLSLGRFAAAYDLQRPTLVEDGLAATDARNLFVDGEVQPISYGVGTHDLVETPRAIAPPAGDRVTVLTGANSGGKTTLLETLCQIALLTAMGLPVPAAEAEVGLFDTIVFHRRHASFNAGVLESTLKSIVPPLTGDGRTLMLVDEFEAITEPGRAADLLNGLVSLTVDQSALGVYVTHLADDLSPLPETARIDGIFAEGLTPDLELQVDYQPRFGTVGKSTPEFIVSRLVANASDRAERAGFESLAAAVGEEAVQRTLSDAEWEN
ncbi:DNA mismatch repair protein [Halohasta salina]|uniref:DNA mismatch repair protein n=1 Tax=Halohasta salina TaxID=2961621 RepID=UPI0020A5EF53|nr:DNA mismatch repair protein [Halohasta salina]